MKRLLTTRAYKSHLYIKPTMAQKKGVHATLEQKNNGCENLCPAALTPQSCRYRLV